MAWRTARQRQTVRLTDQGVTSTDRLSRNRHALDREGLTDFGPRRVDRLIRHPLRAGVVGSKRPGRSRGRALAASLVEGIPHTPMTPPNIATNDEPLALVGS